MITINVKIPKDVFAVVRTMTPRTKRIFNADLKATVQPAVQKQVDDLLGEDPGPVKYPFEFSTARSRAAYFATKGFGRGIPYRRTGQLRKSWKVDITRRGENSYMVIYNPADAAQYVYGSATQRQVPGHRNTGWGKDQQTAAQLIQEDAVDLIIDAWGRAVDQAAKGQG